MLGGFILSKGYENFNNSETSFRKSTLIQERIGLVSTHMYKQFLEYQHATMNTTEIFVEMIDNLKAIADSLKQSFASRGIATDNNIYVDFDKEKSIVIINILWHTIPRKGAYTHSVCVPAAPLWRLQVSLEA